VKITKLDIDLKKAILLCSIIFLAISGLLYKSYPYISTFNEDKYFSSHIHKFIIPQLAKNKSNTSSEVFFCNDIRKLESDCGFVINNKPLEMQCGFFDFPKCEIFYIGSSVSEDLKNFLINTINDPCESIWSISEYRSNDVSLETHLFNFYRCEQPIVDRNYPKRQIREVGKDGNIINTIIIED